MTAIDLPLLRRALAPKEPIDPRPRGDARHAAVASVMRDGPEGAEVLLIRRAERDGDPWSGHMAFPGGRQEAADPDLLATAVRETREEVGLDLAQQGQLITRLEDLPAMVRGGPAGLTVALFVFEVAGRPELSGNRGEVEETLWVPVTPLLLGQWQAVQRYRYRDQDLELPAWDVGGRIVWGLTHRMLSTLLERVRETLG